MSEGEVFRVAVAEDWPAIWPIFHAVVSAGDTYPQFPDTTEADAEAEWMSNPALRRTTFVTELDGMIVATGYVKANAAGLMGHIANGGWMVSHEARGRGLGRRFAEWTLGQAAELGFTHMQFNAVVTSNTAGVKLWTSLGFEIIGELPEAFNHKTDGLTSVYIMYRRL